jgi:hypothetical protein
MDAVIFAFLRFLFFNSLRASSSFMIAYWLGVTYGLDDFLLHVYE